MCIRDSNQTDHNNYNFGYFIVQHYCGYRSVSASNTQSKHTHTHYLYSNNYRCVTILMDLQNISINSFLLYDM